MATKPMSKEADASHVYYEVSVLQHIGKVVEGEDSFAFPPLKLAVMMATDHFAENATQENNTFEYHLTDPNVSDRRLKVTFED